MLQSVRDEYNHVSFTCRYFTRSKRCGFHFLRPASALRTPGKKHGEASAGAKDLQLKNVSAGHLRGPRKEG